MTRNRWGGAVWMVVAVLAALPLGAQERGVNGPTDPPGTFSILGFDPETGEIGAAVQSRVFSVGNGVLWAEAGVGAVATQAIVNVNYGPRAMGMLKMGMAPKDIIPAVLAGDLLRDLPVRIERLEAEARARVWEEQYPSDRRATALMEP